MTRPNKNTIIEILLKGTLTLQGVFINSSNDTFLGACVYGEDRLQVIYKPARGENPLWDFPEATLAQREAAAYLVSEALGWELVPPTVYRRRGMPAGQGSLQLYIEHDPNYHFFTFSAEDRQRLRPAALFDLLINNADRKGGHILVDPVGHIWLIDHGVCFHEEFKLRTVIWDFSGETIPRELKNDLARLADNLEGGENAAPKLKKLLTGSEFQALKERARALAGAETFPAPDRERRPFPWPPV